MLFVWYLAHAYKVPDTLVVDPQGLILPSLHIFMCLLQLKVCETILGLQKLLLTIVESSIC